MFILFQQSHFLHKIHSSALLFKHIVLGSNGKKTFYDQIFITMRMT